MAQQRLYTEEQVRTIIGKAQMLNLDDEFLFSEDYLISSETPIELPTDEEIEKRINTQYEKYYIFSEGAKWMRDQILNK